MMVKQGDTVAVMSGRDRGKTGKVTKVFPQDFLLLVENINEVTRHKKPRRQGEKGQKVSIPAPIHASNVKLVCPSCKKNVRIKIVDSNRTCKKCNSTF